MRIKIITLQPQNSHSWFERTLVTESPSSRPPVPYEKDEDSHSLEEMVHLLVAYGPRALPEHHNHNHEAPVM